MIDPATLHRRARRVLPEKIGTDAVIVEAMDDATLTMLLAPLAHRRRGCLLFRRLSSQTIAALVWRARPVICRTHARPWEGLEQALDASPDVHRMAEPRSGRVSAVRHAQRRRPRGVVPHP
ncbi:hypothetical protein [Pseudoxanthomonas mexicana]